ncbi:MAG: aquaporin [Candidatus Pacebacteria bacterium]|nr:aquaporin [Candidatus Paceibacterota bacterium]
MKAYLAELIGTALLIIGGAGAVIFAGGSLGIFGIALAFGLSLTVIAFLIGGISGAHVNPAVTIALALSGKFPWNKVLGYIVAQIVGAITGAVILYTVVTNVANSSVIINSGFATNVLSGGVSVISGSIIEIVMTMVLCLVVLATTRASWPQSSTPFAIGIALFIANIVAIPLTGASINPARSIGTALVSGQNIGSLPLFIIAPIFGAVLAYFIHIFVFGREHHHHEG